MRDARTLGVAGDRDGAARPPAARHGRTAAAAGTRAGVGERAARSPVARHGRTGAAAGTRAGAARRRHPWLRALLALTVAVALHAPAAVGAFGRAPLVQGVGAVGLTVADMERSVAFFTGVLGFEKVSDVEVAGDAYERLQGVFGLRARVVHLRLGGELLALSEYLAPRGRPIQVDSRSNDRWFQHVAIIVRDMDAAYARLRRHRVEHASSGPQTLPAWNAAAGGIRAFYFKDPDGHPLEILEFPPGKGDPKWQRATEALFLGIDHTAIVVGDTEASLGFYRDMLGLRVAGESENYGPEQEHLNNVFGARLRITGLRAAAGPGIELLEYLAPHDGRPTPPDLRANDLAHWQTELRVADAERAARALRAAASEHRPAGGVFGLVSPGAVTLPGAALAFHRGLLVRDPDGHAAILTER